VDSLITLIQGAYQLVGSTTNVNSGDVWGVASILLLLVAALPALISRPPRPEVKLPEATQEISTQPEVVEAPPAKVVESFASRLKKGLSRSHQEIWGRIPALLGSKQLDQEQLEELEELLYSADLGPTMVNELISKLEEEWSGKEIGASEFKSSVSQYLREKMAPIQQQLSPTDNQFNPEHKGEKPKVIMIVGVNGAGKTTTIGKIATKLTAQGASVVVGACDTFRAAAVDQLEVWCERSGASMVRAKEGSNPSGVAYGALEQAQQSGADYCLLDTAGRLHTKGNLMEELNKNKRVLSKLDPDAPHEVWLVLDAITGQNAMRQAEEFNRTLKLTGLIFTKCDGSSKAGSAISIVDQLKVPIIYIGVGESVDDLDIFNLDHYLLALLDGGTPENYH
jgi:fused signal recognition particle receptor